VESEERYGGSGGEPIDQGAARARLSAYLKRETGASADESDRRADEIVTLLRGGAATLLAPVGALASNWWLFTLRGVLAIIFGILTLVQPLAALTVFVLVFGVWAFIDGISALALAVTGWRSWQLVLAGLVGIAVGLFTFFRPEITALGLYAAVAAWSIARGILEIVVAIELRKRIKGELWLVLGGLASITFGVLMVVLPVAGVLALAWLIGVYALVFGVMMVALSLRLRQRLHEPARVERPAGTPTVQPA
jgi:uncharacterized membrane protein HdeD (DUF308 family)